MYITYHISEIINHVQMNAVYLFPNYKIYTLG